MTDRRMIPRTIDHGAFTEALQPLLDLLNVSPDEILADFQISAGGRELGGVESLFTVTFYVVARGTSEDGPQPQGITTHPAIEPVQEFAELVWPARVAVV